MASDFRARAREQRQYLLAELIPSIHRSSLLRLPDVDALVETVEGQLEQHEFHNFNPNRVARQLAEVFRLLSTNSQELKASILKGMVQERYVPWTSQ